MANRTYPIKYMKRKQKLDEEDRETIVKMRNEGKSFMFIGSIVGVSSTRCSQVYKEMTNGRK